jgi:hypothetical protein
VFIAYATLGCVATVVESSSIGIRYGGGKAGTPNKRIKEVEERLRELGCDPISGLARIVMDESNNVEIRPRAYSEPAPSVAAKRKAVGDQSHSYGSHGVTGCGRLP